MDKIVDYLDETVYKIIDYPELFGGYYSAELQILRLLEARLVYLNPSSDKILVHEFYNSMKQNKLIPKDTNQFLTETVNISPPTWRKKVSSWFKWKVQKPPESYSNNSDNKEIKLHTCLGYMKKDWQVFMSSFVSRSWAACTPKEIHLKIIK
jgi:hypothetical protein